MALPDIGDSDLAQVVSNAFRQRQQNTQLAQQKADRNQFKTLTSQYAAASPEDRSAIGAKLFSVDPSAAEQFLGFQTQQDARIQANDQKQAAITAHKLYAVANAPEGQAAATYAAIAPDHYKALGLAGAIGPDTTDEQIRQVAKQHLPEYMARAGLTPQVKEVSKGASLVSVEPLSGKAQTAFSNPETEVAKVNPADFSTESVDKYRKSGNYGDLKRVYPPNASFLATNALQGDALDLAAEKYRVTGSVPPGMGRSPATTAKIIARAAELASAKGDNAAAVVLKQQANKAAQGALSKLTTQQNLVGAFEKTANKNLDLALQLSDKVDRTGSPIINRALLHFKKDFAGDPDTASFVNALTAARTEYAKVLSGATSATGITDSARKEANDLFSSASTPEQLTAVIQTARQEMANRMSAFDDQKKELQPSLSGANPQPAPAPAPAPQHVAPNGAVAVNSPEEAMKLPPGTRFVTPDGRLKVRP